MLQRGLKKLLLRAAGCLAGLLVVELGLHLFSEPQADLFFWAPDQITGWKGYPGAEGRSAESNSFVWLNSQGAHDREHSRRKPAHVLRTAVLGDSMTEGIEVPTDRTFTAVLERELVACTAVSQGTVEVLNFGVRGYGTSQELLALRARVWNYDPDVVVLAFFTGNDVTDNSFLVAPYHRPYFVRQGNRLVPDYSHCVRYPSLQKLRYWLRHHSRIVQLLLRAIVPHRRSLRRTDSPSFVGDGLGVDERVYRSPTDLAWQEAWQTTEDQIVLMRDEVTSKGAHFLLVTLDNPVQVYPDASLRLAYMKHLGVDTLFYPDFRLRDLGQREGISVLTLAPILQSYADQQRIFLHGFSSQVGHGHWNEAGHRLVGKLIAGKICDDVIGLQH